MEELVELRRYIEQQRYAETLDLIAEMEEMSREDKINKIYSFAEILLLHLIKQEAEKGRAGLKPALLRLRSLQTKTSVSRCSIPSRSRYRV
jgi:hypothetical protein